MVVAGERERGKWRKWIKWRLIKQCQTIRTGDPYTLNQCLNSYSPNDIDMSSVECRFGEL